MKKYTVDDFLWKMKACHENNETTQNSGQLRCMAFITQIYQKRNFFVYAVWVKNPDIIPYCLLSTLRAKPGGRDAGILILQAVGEFYWQ